MEYLDQSLKDLFVDLHCSGLWVDVKAISDSILRAPAEEICAAYDKARSEGHVDLQAFYDHWFAPAQSPGDAYQTNPDHDARQHLEAVWPHLTCPADDGHERSTRFPLPHPYVIAGGRFGEAYYWDSYFTQLGLLRSGRTTPALTRRTRSACSKAAIDPPPARVGGIPRRRTVPSLPTT